MRTKFRISVPGFYSVARYARVRGIGDKHLVEPGVWKVKVMQGELTAYKNGDLKKVQKHI